MQLALALALLRNRGSSLQQKRDADRYRFRRGQRGRRRRRALIGRARTEDRMAPLLGVLATMTFGIIDFSLPQGINHHADDEQPTKRECNQLP